ncbi:MAG: ABC transporter permease [Candidatus Nomurabacteria bacterium]|nr:ABC transporter permease [Candidatus Nomurabacteria bacterium]
MNSLKTVVKFEILRSLKKKSFWVSALLLPILLVGYIVFAGAMGSNVEGALKAENENADAKLAILDEAGLMKSELTENWVKVSEKNIGIKDVRDGDLDAFVFIAQDFTENPKIEVFANNKSLFSDYSAVISGVLVGSALADLEASEQIILTHTYATDTTTFVDGEEGSLLGKMVVPLVALGLFYVLVILFSNRLTTSTIEEKENRITEMLLTAIPAKTLILGKIFSLIALGVLQTFIIIVPLILVYAFGRGTAIMGMDLGAILANVEINPLTILTSFVLLAASYVLFVGLCVLVGSLVPTAKEVSSYSSIIMILTILPVFSISSFLAAMPDALVYVLSYFPVSAPVALMMRSAFGTLPWYELLIGTVVIIISSIVITRFAIRVFQYGAMEFTSKISLRKMLTRK